MALRIAAPKQECNSNVIEAIYARRSIRQYTDCAVEREKLMEVARAGIAAPNAMNRQAWAVRIVDSKEWIDACTAAFVPTIEGTPFGEHLLTADFKNMFRNAPTVAFIANDTTFAYSPVDCGLMAENMRRRCLMGTRVNLRFIIKKNRMYMQEAVVVDVQQLLLRDILWSSFVEKNGKRYYLFQPVHCFLK